jgi:class 3 adenylate cyclase
MVVWGQENSQISAIEQSYKKQFGIARLVSLNQLTAHYQIWDDKKALRYGKMAEALAESIFKKENVLVDDQLRSEKLMAHEQLGEVYFKQGKYSNASACATKAQQEAVLLNNPLKVDRLTGFISQIDSLNTENGFSARLKRIKISNAIGATSSSIKISAILTLARKYEKSENYTKAIAQYKQALNLLQNKGEAVRIATIHQKIAELYQLSGQKESAVAFYQIAVDNYEKLGDTTALASSQQELKTLFKKPRPLISKQELDLPQYDTLDLAEIEKDMNRFQELAIAYEEKNDYDQSLKYYKQYIALNSRFEQEQQLQQLDSIELQSRAQTIRLLEQDNQLGALQLLRQNEEIMLQQRSRNLLVAGVVLLVSIAVLLCWLFFTKRRAHRDLTITYNDLDKSQKLLGIAQQKIKKLLGQQVSDQVAQALISESKEEAIISKFVCIMFLDIRDFTPFASARPPAEVIAYQNDVFGFMIDIIDKHNGVINQFMGDGFMATFGVPISHAEDVKNAYQASLEIVEQVNERSQSGQIPHTRIGIGLHAGQVVAGNVGTDVRKQYSVTGTPVITAARIEQLNKTFKSQFLISEAVKAELNGMVPEEVEGVPTKLKGLDEPIMIYKIS